MSDRRRELKRLDLRRETLRTLGLMDDALKSFDRALSLRPKYPKAHNNRGTVLEAQGQLAPALECYEKALALSPNFKEARNNRTRVLCLLNRFDEALAAFTQMLAAGMFERYPRMKCAVLEAGSNWITAWLDRMDHKTEVMHAFTPMKLLPSEYFKRQIYATFQESPTAMALLKFYGPDNLLWASDQPRGVQLA